MGGLEKILKDIADSAELEASKILEASNREVAEIRIQCEKDKLALAEDLKKETQEECMKVSGMIEAAAEDAARQIILAAKSKAIAEIIEYLKEDIKKSDEYFDLLLTLVKNHSEADDGVMYFNKNDLSRLPADFAEKAQECAKGNLTIATETVDLDAGFIIKYGKIEINCSIDSIFEEKKNRLSNRAKESLRWL